MLRVRNVAVAAAAIALPYLFPWTPAQAQRVATRADLVVTPQWLNEHLKDKNLVVLHVGPKNSFDSVHVAGARFIEMDNLSTPRAPGALSLEMPAVTEIRATLEKLGISDDSRIVVVPSDEWISPATRVMLTLDYVGLGNQSSILDTGFEGWKRANYAVARTATATPTPGRLSARATQPLIVDHEFVQSHAATPHFKLIDARAPVFYDGPPHGDQKAGHIKGASNLPFDKIFADSSRVESTEALKKMFTDAGVQPGDTVVAYCHIGQQGTAVLFGARLLGHPVRLYDGSFQDWNNRKLPVEGGTSK